MSEVDIVSLLQKVKRGYNDFDIKFMEKVYDDMQNYKNDNTKNVALIFPPLDASWRYLIHKLSEEVGLFGFTVGEGIRRLVIVINMKRIELSAERLDTTILTLHKDRVMIRQNKYSVINNAMQGNKANNGKKNSLNIDAREFYPGTSIRKYNVPQFLPMNENNGYNSTVYYPYPVYPLNDMYYYSDHTCYNSAYCMRCFGSNIFYYKY